MAMPLTACAASPDKSEFKYTNLDEFGMFCEMTLDFKGLPKRVEFQVLTTERWEA